MPPNEDQNQTVPAPPTPEPVPTPVAQATPPPAPTPILGTAAAPTMPAVPAQATVEPTVSNPGVIVLQWLTYAFWGWTILGMSILTTMVLANFINQAETGGFMPYGIAAVLVLLPISIACDVFYSKKEPTKKTGGASIVMVIHAVIFALFGIGALIGIVFAIISMVTSSGSDNKDRLVMLFSSMVIAVLYGATFLRTINPEKVPFVRRFYVIFMTIVVGLVSILGIVGPMATERATRNDRLIESNLSNLKSEIDRYATSNKRLPNSLSELTLREDTKLMVDKQLVKYTANTKQPTTTSTGYSRTRTSTTSTYYYELCVNFVKAKNSHYSTSRDITDTDGYTTYISPYYHHAGEECYKVKTNDYDY